MNIERLMDILSTGTVLIITMRSVKKDISFSNCLMRSLGACLSCIVFSMYFGFPDKQDREWMGIFYITSQVVCALVCIYINEYIRSREHLHKHFDAVWLGYIALLTASSLLNSILFAK